MAYIIVETTYIHPPDNPSPKDHFTQIQPCMRHRNIRWVRSFVSDDRRRVISEVDAADAESVRQSLRIAGIPFERIWAATIMTPPNPPSLSPNQVRQSSTARKEETAIRSGPLPGDGPTP